MAAYQGCSDGVKGPKVRQATFSYDLRRPAAAELTGCLHDFVLFTPKFSSMSNRSRCETFHKYSRWLVSACRSRRLIVFNGRSYKSEPAESAAITSKTKHRPHCIIFTCMKVRRFHLIPRIFSLSSFQGHRAGLASNLSIAL